MLAGSYLSHPQSLSEPAQERLRKSFEAKYAGIDKAHRLMVLEEGMKLDQIGVSPEDAQALEGRRFQVNEVSRIFNIAPHRLFELSHATFSNIEHQGLEYVTYTLTPWLTRIEKRLRKDLLSSTEKATFYFEFLADALLRGDLKSMNEAMQIEYQNGWLTADEARQIKNRNPLPDGLGQKHYRPANLFEIGMEPPPPDPAMAGAAPTQGAMV
jgi:HK97 family phage portal protein